MCSMWIVFCPDLHSFNALLNSFTEAKMETAVSQFTLFKSTASVEIWGEVLSVQDY